MKSLVIMAFCVFGLNLFAQEAKVIYSDLECIASCDNYQTRITIVPQDGWSTQSFKCNGVQSDFIVKVYGKDKKFLETFINKDISNVEYRRAIFGCFTLDAVKAGLINIHNGDNENITCAHKGDFDELIKNMK